MNQEGKNQRPRMAELSRNEEKSNENHKYQGCIFKQDNSDDNFNQRLRRSRARKRKSKQH